MIGACEVAKDWLNPRLLWFRSLALRFKPLSLREILRF